MHKNKKFRIFAKYGTFCHSAYQFGGDKRDRTADLLNAIHPEMTESCGKIGITM
nr:MAG TPA: hypothetical protein [Caudoviricetes sp.]